MSDRKSPRWSCALVLLVALLLGCSGSGSLDTSYGVSHGRSGHNSINGFGGLREGYHAAGWKSRTIKRLGDRMMRLDAVVWTPSQPVSIHSDETRWFESWLSGGGKTLIYVIHDGGSEADYWRNAARLAPPAQRFEYRRRAARAEFTRREYLRSQYVSPGNGWFQTAPLPYPQPLGQPRGRWAPPASAYRSPDERPEPIPGLAHGDLQVLYRITDFDRDTAPPPISKTVVFGPGMNIQLNDDETGYSDAPVGMRTMLASEQNVPVVSRITSPSWKKSQVIIVSGGSLLSNYGLTTVPGRQLGANLVSSSGPPGQVGFLVSGAGGVRISDAVSEENRKTGMELLTVWPMSLVTIHLALVGLVVCLILAPIFGRPRDDQAGSPNDFADHIDAIATLMKRMDSDQYARHRISEYMRRVRGETSGPWVLSEAVNQPSQQRPAATSQAMPVFAAPAQAAPPAPQAALVPPMDSAVPPPATSPPPEPPTPMPPTASESTPESPPDSPPAQ